MSLGAYRSAAKIPPNARHLLREGIEHRDCLETDSSIQLDQLKIDYLLSFGPLACRREGDFIYSCAALFARRRGGGKEVFA